MKNLFWMFIVFCSISANASGGKLLMKTLMSYHTSSRGQIEKGLLVNEFKSQKTIGRKTLIFNQNMDKRYIRSNLKIETEKRVNADGAILTRIKIDSVNVDDNIWEVITSRMKTLKNRGEINEYTIVPKSEMIQGRAHFSMTIDVFNLEDLRANEIMIGKVGNILDFAVKGISAQKSSSIQVLQTRNQVLQSASR